MATRPKEMLAFPIALALMIELSVAGKGVRWLEEFRQSLREVWPPRLILVLEVDEGLGPGLPGDAIAPRRDGFGPIVLASQAQVTPIRCGNGRRGEILVLRQAERRAGALERL